MIRCHFARLMGERKLKIANLLPIHGRMVPLSEMMSVAVPAATSGE